jgi:hypothetical protein
MLKIESSSQRSFTHMFILFLLASIHSGQSKLKYIKVFSSAAAFCITCIQPSNANLDNSKFESLDIEARPPPITIRQKMIRNSEKILTNPVLENFRKADQLDADEQAEPQTTKALYLVPILSVNEDLRLIGNSLKSISRSNLKSDIELTLRSILDILNKEVYETKTFKKTFNKYADNIYYSDPREANLYLAGGTTPSSKQTTQYLLRNELLTSISNIKDDVISLLKDGIEDDMAIEDTLDDVKEAQDTMIQYLEMADRQDLDVAKKIFK